MKVLVWSEYEDEEDAKTLESVYDDPRYAMKDCVEQAAENYGSFECPDIWYAKVVDKIVEFEIEIEYDPVFYARRKK